MWVSQLCGRPFFSIQWWLSDSPEIENKCKAAMFNFSHTLFILVPASSLARIGCTPFTWMRQPLLSGDDFDGQHAISIVAYIYTIRIWCCETVALNETEILSIFTLLERSSLVQYPPQLVRIPVPVCKTDILLWTTKRSDNSYCSLHPRGTFVHPDLRTFRKTPLCCFVPELKFKSTCTFDMHIFLALDRYR